MVLKGFSLLPHPLAILIDAHSLGMEHQYPSSNLQKDEKRVKEERVLVSCHKQEKEITYISQAIANAARDLITSETIQLVSGHGAPTL